MKRLFIIFLVLIFHSFACYANELTFAQKIRKIFYYRTTKSKPLQVKIIPSNAACNPDTDTPKDCDVKR